jgi:hypothetical protein
MQYWHFIQPRYTLKDQNSRVFRDVLKHPNSAKYPRQFVFVVTVGDYAYLVPFLEEEDHYFLKTIIPSRKATRDYLRNGEDDEET